MADPKTSIAIAFKHAFHNTLAGHVFSDPVAVAYGFSENTQQNHIYVEDVSSTFDIQGSRGFGSRPGRIERVTLKFTLQVLGLISAKEKLELRAASIMEEIEDLLADDPQLNHLVSFAYIESQQYAGSPMDGNAFLVQVEASISATQHIN